MKIKIIESRPQKADFFWRDKRNKSLARQTNIKIRQDKYEYEI